jgi:hypothetical protein
MLQNYPFESPPVLIIFFNRPECLKEQILSVLNAGVKKIYFASDGPRRNQKNDELLVKECRVLVESLASQIESVDYFYSAKNLGCDSFVPYAINWFFSRETMGVILEDDCIINESFLQFSSFTLKKYFHQREIMCISAANFQSQRVGDGDYFFSKYPYTWGWATWARAWNHYKDDPKDLCEVLKNGKIDQIFKDRKQSKYWRKMLLRLVTKKINFWDAKWYFSIWVNGGVSITPNKNLVKNIGFGDDATHTKDKRENPNMIIEPLLIPFKEPSNYQLDHDADKELFMSRFYPTLFGYYRVIKLKIFKFLNF